MMILTLLLHILMTALSMIWEVGWSLVLGFVLSGMVQVFVPRNGLQKSLGRDSWIAIVRATLYGAASSSCSYASAAMTKSLFARGAGLIPSFAFLFASTNLVIELGAVLWQLMGWEFAVAEWVGGVILVALVSIFARLTQSQKRTDEAYQKAQAASSRADDREEEAGSSWWQRLWTPSAGVNIAQSVANDWSMLREDFVIGIVVASLIMTLLPKGIFDTGVLSQLQPSLREFLEIIIAPALACLSFVCSIGNVPLAAALWASGFGFGGVLAFLYSDLLVIPLLLIYAKSFGRKMALYMATLFYVTIVIAALMVAWIFSFFHAIPQAHPIVRMNHLIKIDATLVLNFFALCTVILIAIVNKKHSEKLSCRSDMSCHREEPGVPKSPCCGD